MTFLSALLFVYRSSDVWMWAVVGAGVGLGVFFHGFQLLSRRRLIANTPASKIRSASIGLVEVSGLAVGPYTMTAPITSNLCYYYRTKAWKWKQQGKNREWVQVADESLHVPFYLDDNTGRVLVNPQGAEMDIHRDFHEEYSDSFFSTKDAVPDNVRSFLYRYGVYPDTKIKVEEYCIKPKNALFILGTLAENPGTHVTPTPIPTLTKDAGSVQFNLGSGTGAKLLNALTKIPGATTTVTTTWTAFSTKGENFSSQEIIRLGSGQPKPSGSADVTQQERIAAALTKAGISNPAAWAAAGVPYSPAAVQVATPSSADGSAAAATAPGFDLSPKAVLMKGANNPAFFISWRSQRDVLSSLGWKSALYIWGGPALTLLCVYILAVHFDWL